MRINRTLWRTFWVSIIAIALPVAARAQADFSGEWNPLSFEDLPERIPGPELGDYMGLPVNDAARMRADSYDADRISIVSEYQCRPHGGDYSMRGLANMRVDNILDPVTQQIIGFHTRMGFQEMERYIWLDGRPHPGPLAQHSWQGFFTGTFDGKMLNVFTTHLKQNYLRRNGLSRSEKATFTEHWMRHGEYLTVTTVITDPAFLTKPLVRSQSWVLDPSQQMTRDICEYAQEVPTLRADYVPHHLLGTNLFLHEVSDWYGLPNIVTRGGAESMYPEYREKMPKPENSVPVCQRYCNCGAQNNPFCLLGPDGR